MDILTELINKIEEIDINKVLDEYFTKNKEFILNLNKEQLYEFGVDANNEEIGQYTSFTKVLKRRKGQRADHITLKDTGKFYDSFKLKFDGQNLVFDANPYKENVNLFERYGIDVLGLNEDSQNYMLFDLRDFIIKKYDEILD
jgi:hypothetical protein